MITSMHPGGKDLSSLYLASRDACMKCGACVQNCPVQAISVRTGVGCAYAALASSKKQKTCCGASCC